jgi:hypothetical protein
MQPKPGRACLEMRRCNGISRDERYAKQQAPRHLRTGRALEDLVLDSRRVTHGVIQDDLHQVHLSAARRTLHRPALALEPGRAE